MNQYPQIPMPEVRKQLRKLAAKLGQPECTLTRTEIKEELYRLAGGLYRKDSGHKRGPRAKSALKFPRNIFKVIGL
jgi:hypothetical protein